MKNRGFSIVELMIVLAIIGILVSVAAPRYRAHIIEGYAGDTRGELSGMMALQNSHRTSNFVYAANLSAMPDYTTNVHTITYDDQAGYTVQIRPCTGYADNPGTDSCYMLEATPVGDMAEFGTIRMDSRGKQEVVRGGSTYNWDDL